MKQLKHCLLLAVAAICLNSASLAQVSVDGSGTVSVVAALTLVEDTPMAWGTVARPGNGTTDYTLNYATGAVTLSATTSTAFPGFAWDNGAAGAWTLSGEASTAVTFNISIAAFDGTGVTVIAGHINGASNSGSDTLSVGGTLALATGGIIRVAANASLGLHTSVVTVSADYQ
jgi:hypothetical protein